MCLGLFELRRICVCVVSCVFQREVAARAVQRSVYVVMAGMWWAKEKGEGKEGKRKKIYCCCNCSLLFVFFCPVGVHNWASCGIEKKKKLCMARHSNIDREVCANRDGRGGGGK